MKQHKKAGTEGIQVSKMERRESALACSGTAQDRAISPEAWDRIGPKIAEGYVEWCREGISVTNAQPKKPSKKKK